MLKTVIRIPYSDQGLTMSEAFDLGGWARDYGQGESNESGLTPTLNFDGNWVCITLYGRHHDPQGIIEEFNEMWAQGNLFQHNASKLDEIQVIHEITAG